MMRTSIAAATAVAALLALGTGCVEDQFVTLEKGSNAVRARSVLIDAAQCLRKDGKFSDCATANPFDLRRVDEMRGVIGAPTRAIALDDDANARQNFGRVSPLFVRVPMGYGCEATLQGIFPKSNPSDKEIADIKNYQLGKLSQLIGSVKSSGGVALWTAGYGLGDGKKGCSFKAHTVPYPSKAQPEQQGTVIADPVKWAKVVRRIGKYFNRDLVTKNKGLSACKNPQNGIIPWDCTPSLFNIEFGRDPNGAGGFTDATKKKWLDSYTQFSTELRKEFSWPDNTVRIMGPSVVIRGQLDVQNTKGSKRSWLFDFVDHVVAKKLSISHLSFEVVAKSPVEAYNIVKAIRTYVDAAKMVNDDGQPIGLFVTDLRLDPTALPPSVRPDKDPARYSAYEGVFFAASKILWQGMVSGATVGRVMRFPTKDPATDTPENIGQTALDSNLMWFNDANIASGSVKPAAWHAFWFHPTFLGGGGGKLDWEPDPTKAKDKVAEARKKSILRGTHGPDAIGLGGTKKVDSSKGLIVLATREKCVYPAKDPKVGEPKDCVEDIDPQTGNKKTLFPAVTEGRKRAIRVMVADGNVDGSSTKEVLEHRLRVQIDNLPKDVTTVGYRWARMNGNEMSFGGFVFPEQGVIDVKDGSFAISRSVAVPSLHYFEFLY